MSYARGKTDKQIDPKCTTLEGNRSHAPEGRDVLCVAHRRVERPAEADVHVVPEPLVDAALLGRARAREEVAVVMAMHRDEEYAWVGVEDLLC